MYRAARDRRLIAVSFDELKLPVSHERAIEILQSEKVGFRLFRSSFSETVVSLARVRVGISEYCRGASLNEAPYTFDCSSFIWWIYSHIGIELERRSIDQRRQGELVDRKDIRAGDLVFSSGAGRSYYYEDEPDVFIGHVAMSTGEGTIIHATRRSDASGVIEEDESVMLDCERFVDIRRIVPRENDFYVFEINPRKTVFSTKDVRWFILQNLNA